MAYKRVLWLLVAAIAVAGAGVAVAQASTRDRSHHRYGHSGFGDWRSGSRTATPIKHVVVIFQENVSFDHYFGTYPTRRTPTASGSMPRAAPPRSTVSRRRPALRCRRTSATATTC